MLIKTFKVWSIRWLLISTIPWWGVFCFFSLISSFELTCYQQYSVLSTWVSRFSTSWQIRWRHGWRLITLRNYLRKLCWYWWVQVFKDILESRQKGISVQYIDHVWENNWHLLLLHSEVPSCCRLADLGKSSLATTPALMLNLLLSLVREGKFS